MKPIRVGLIGCGTIGRELALFLTRKFSGRVRLSAVSEHRPEKALALSRELHLKLTNTSLQNLVDRADFIIEAASAEAAGPAAALALKNNKSILVMSAGGLLQNKIWQSWLNKSSGTLWVPSGAVAGLDGLLAARESGLKRVTLITRKPPEALRGAPYFTKKKFPRLSGRAPRCVFRGSAAEAVRGFPQNVNVAAVLSLAGMGELKTRVEIWTARGLAVNSHEIRIHAASGDILIRTDNRPAPHNPKTSALAFYSAMALLRKIFSPARIGT